MKCKGIPAVEIHPRGIGETEIGIIIIFNKKFIIHPTLANENSSTDGLILPLTMMKSTDDEVNHIFGAYKDGIMRSESRTTSHYHLN